MFSGKALDFSKTAPHYMAKNRFPGLPGLTDWLTDWLTYWLTSWLTSQLTAPAD